ncbi:MAG TPA: hypothetical protein VG871_14540 [Vicinamibacterales bacterium]|nr:hypothetical protein [Vicinamibacterales bacterium]
MIHRPAGIGAFEFAVLASLRASQLCRGCLPRIDGEHTVAVTAQMEVAGGTVSSVQATPGAAETPADVAADEPSLDAAGL